MMSKPFAFWIDLLSFMLLPTFNPWSATVLLAVG